MSSRAAHAAAVVVLTAVSTVSWPGSPAVAAGSAGYCPDASGVTVVVDFHELGGGTVVRCASGTQATGLAALKNAGFEVTGTLRWGEGFICRIDGKPSAASEKCVDTPPASAYWSYWHAANGGGWAYSDKGVLNRKPPAGSFEGWSFSLNRDASDAPRPGVTPKRPAPTPPPPPPPPTPPAAGGGPAAPPAAAGGGPVVPPAGGAGHTTTLPPAGTPSAIAEGTASAGVPATSPTSVPATTPGGVVGSSGGAAGVPATEIAASDSGDGGLPLGTVAGAVLLAVLAAGGVVTARRRRAVDPDD
ncbi:hypothetical protein [Micromonospora sp. HUAS LYJ1]|uniref:hypothetical protein n=1 Tax=Micromonospora sp. HUAS LYJ1 TaxID=3061626 RepID=UPI002672FDC2|nr:hypothetical protein [Micromonospora sp. HUAS LYJ1]WKU05673.1 hypothetical protein Q2K16_00985 [Micromonospora sp. HUAS LYJ1]